MNTLNKQLNDKVRVLKDPSYCINEVSGVNGILAGLYRKILAHMGINPGRFDILLDRFISINRKSSSNRVVRMLTRGNLNRELFKPAMSFKVFMKGLKILGVKKVKFLVECEFDYNRNYISDIVVDLGNDDMDLLDDDEEEKEQ